MNPSLTLVSLLGALFAGCVERDAEPSFAVTQVTPIPLLLDAEITIEGRGFGESQGEVSISARPINVQSWTDQRITATLPIDTPRGERFLVVSREGQQTQPFPIYIAGELSSRPGGGRPEFGAVTDFTLPRDLGTSDQAVDMVADMERVETVDITLTDPSAPVVIEAEVNEDQGLKELWVHIVARDPRSLGAPSGWDVDPLWGAAGQLTFPSQQLRYLRMGLPDGPNAAGLAGEEPERVYWYHGNLVIENMAERATLMTLRFEILNPENAAPITIGFVPRFSSLRGVKNQRLNHSWSGGEITLLRRGDTP